MVKNWYMLRNKYRPQIMEIKHGYLYLLTMEDDNCVYFIGEDGEEVYFNKWEEGTVFRYTRKSEFICAD